MGTRGAVAHRWLTLAEHGAFRVVVAALGLVMVVVGLALGVTMIMLPAGLVVGLIGLAILLWGVLGTLPGKPAEGGR